MREQSITGLLWVLLGVAVVALSCVLGWYVYAFGTQPSPAHNVWGEFGDYFGGTLNPIFGFLTFIAIVMTLVVQARQLNVSHTELELSREELAASREELRKSAEAQQATADAMKEQTKFTALSAKIAAVSAAIEAIDQEMNRQRAAEQGHNALAFAAIFGTSEETKKRRATLEAKLEKLISEAEAA